ALRHWRAPFGAITFVPGRRDRRTRPLDAAALNPPSGLGFADGRGGFHVSFLHFIVRRRVIVRFACWRRAVGEVFQMLRMLALACAVALSAGPALAQQPAASATLPYGPPIGLDQAKRAMAAAELEAAKNSLQVAITILDSGGNWVMFHRFDNAQLSATTVSEGKARTALEFKRPSKALDDAIAAGGAGMRLLALKNITPIEGGQPI